MTDVFPRRNLPPDAENWGREFERRTVDTEKEVKSLDQSLQGLNRSTASSLQTLARQIKQIPITDVAGIRRDGFAVGSSFATLTSLDIESKPNRTASIFFTAEAGAEAVTGVSVTDLFMRVVVNGQARPDVYMPFAGFGGSTGGGNRSAGVTSESIQAREDQNITIQLQMRSSDPSLTPTRASNYATIYAMVVYSGEVDD